MLKVEVVRMEEAMPLPENRRDSAPYFMYEEIQVQPSAVSTAIERGRSAPDIAELLERSRRVYLVGNGTSLHAAQAAAVVLDHVNPGRQVQAVQAYEFVTNPRPLDDGDLVFVVSHAGESRMALEANATARAGGATTVAVTGFPRGSVAGKAEHVLLTGYDKELSWAHTVSYTGAIAALSSLAAVSARSSSAGREVAEALDGISEKMTDALALESSIQKLIDDVNEVRNIWFVGAGPDEITAREAALKMIETNSTPSIGMELEQMLHGYLPAIDSRDLIWQIVPGEVYEGRSQDLLRAASIVGIPTILQKAQAEGQAAGGPESTQQASGRQNQLAELVLPTALPVLTPLLHIIPVQLLSYVVTLKRNLNPGLIGRAASAYRQAADSYT